MKIKGIRREIITQHKDFKKNFFRKNENDMHQTIDDALGPGPALHG